MPNGKGYYKGQLVNDKVKPSPGVIDTNRLGEVRVSYVYQGARAEIIVRVVDRVKPSIPQIVLRKDNKNGKVYIGNWYSGDIYEEYQSTDYSKPGIMGSGIDYYEISTDGSNYQRLDSNYHIDEENGEHTYYVRSVDKSGNIGDSNTYHLKIDKEVPSCSLEVKSGTLGSNGWYTSGITIGFKSITEKISGIEKQNISDSGITYDTKNKVVTATIQDLAGNKNSCSIKVSIDLTNPKIEYSIGGGIYGRRENVRVTGIDSNFKNMSVHVYKEGMIVGEKSITNDTRNPYEVGLDSDGNWTIYSQVYDESGRKQEQKPDNGEGWYYQNYVIDTKAPTCSLKVTSGTIGNNGWYRSDVVVGFDKIDGTGTKIISSFVDKPSVTNEGVSIVTGTVTDEAGNIGTCQIEIKKDTKAPTCIFTGESSTWSNHARTITATCSDGTSNCTRETASKVWSYSSGTHKVEKLSYTMIDEAGNSSLCSKEANIYVDKEGPTIPTTGGLGDVSGSNTTGSIQTEATGSIDAGVGGVSYKYLIKNTNSTPSNNDNGFQASKDFTRSCGTSYYAWVVAEDKLGNRSEVKYIGATSDGINQYSDWSSCSASCGGGVQTRTNTCALVTTGLSQSCNAQSCCAYASGHSWEFNYTGGVQDFTVPCSGTYKLEVYGAQGGWANKGGNPGLGGYSSGTKHMLKDTPLYIAVGGKGVDFEVSDYSVVRKGGYNGGGDGYAGKWDGNFLTVGGGGGGATHIATTNRGELKNYTNYRSEVLIVAGGGGGANTRSRSGCDTERHDEKYTIIGGNGGVSSDAVRVEYRLGNMCNNDYTSEYFTCATYQFGIGKGYDSVSDFDVCGSGHTHYAFTMQSGGGGGWYGGSNSAGGSSYIGDVKNGSMQSGVRTDHGLARITLVSTD